MDTKRVENFLAHYSSQYYDPVKAHDYYMRTRELKGRQSAGLSKESLAKQREGVSYASNQISEKRKAQLDANTARINALNTAAKDQAEAYKARMEKLQTDVQTARDKIVSDLNAYLEKVNGELKIPANASPKLKAFLQRQNAIRSNSASNKANADMSKIRNSIMASIENARAAYDDFRNSNAADRQIAYNERRAINTSASNDLATEKKNIREQVR